MLFASLVFPSFQRTKQKSQSLQSINRSRFGAFRRDRLYASSSLLNDKKTLTDFGGKRTRTGKGRKQMPVIWLRAAIRHSRYHRHLGRLQVEALCSSSAAPTDSHIVRLILDQKSASEALRTFRWASNLPNFSHSQSTYRALIHKLCSFRRFDAVKDLLDEMPRSLGSPPDDDTFITLIRGLGRAGMVRRVLKVPDIVSKFHGNTMPSVKIFNSVLNVLVKENIDLARDFYRNHMMASGVQGDDYTFGILMKGLCSTNRIADAFKLLQLIKSCGITPNAVIYNTLLHALCKNGSVGRARSLMNDMDEPSDVTFNILISAYCAERNLVQALVLLEKCFSSGFLPDIVTVTKVLEVLCELGRVSEAVKILERVESAGGTVDVMAHNTLIKGFCQLGKPKVGHQIVKEMENKGCLPNVDTYNVLISGFCKSGMLESAVDLFNEMKTDGIKWNFDTYDVLIRGLCLGGQTKDGLEILQLMEESKDGCGGRISPYNSILYGFYNENRTDEGLEFLKNLERLFPDVVDKSLKILDLCKEGKTKDAKSIYDQMISKGRAPSAFVYGHLVSGFCQEGCLREALELTNEMIGCGYSPIASTLNSLIREFYSQGRSDSAIKLMEDMVGRGCVLDAGSYIPVLHALCRDGDFEKALKIFSQMEDKGIVPDCFSWNSLLLCLSQETEWLEKNHKVEVNKKLEYIMESC